MRTRVQIPNPAFRFSTFFPHFFMLFYCYYIIFKYLLPCCHVYIFFERRITGQNLSNENDIHYAALIRGLNSTNEMVTSVLLKNKSFQRCASILHRFLKLIDSGFFKNKSKIFDNRLTWQTLDESHLMDNSIIFRPERMPFCQISLSQLIHSIKNANKINYIQSHFFLSI